MRELILGVAESSADAHVLRRLQIERGAGHPGELRPQSRDDVVGADLPFCRAASET